MTPARVIFRMKRALIGFAFAAILAAAGGRYYVEFRTPPPPPPIDARVTDGLISLALTEVNPGQLQLTVRNDSPAAISYAGYSPSQPIYTLEVLRDETWRSENGWCGNSIGTRVLKAKESFTAEIYFDPRCFAAGTSLRVAMGFSLAPRSDWERSRFLREIQSNELSYSQNGTDSTAVK